MTGNLKDEELHRIARRIAEAEQEWDEFRLHVTDWELDKYLEVF